MPLCLHCKAAGPCVVCSWIMIAITFVDELFPSLILRLLVQSMHSLFQEIQAQLSFALAPTTAPFSVFQPDSVFLPSALGPFPWSLLQMDNCLAIHTEHVASFIQYVCLEALNCCASNDVTRALGGTVPDEFDPDTPPMTAAMVAIRTRASFNLRAAACSMVVSSAVAFADSIESFCSSSTEDVLQGRSPVVESWGTAPLLKLDLLCTKRGLECSPPIEDVCSQLLARFDDMATSLTEVNDGFAASLGQSRDEQMLTSDGWCTHPLFLAARCAPLLRTCFLAGMCCIVPDVACKASRADVVRVDTGPAWRLHWSRRATRLRRCSHCTSLSLMP